MIRSRYEPILMAAELIELGLMLNIPADWLVAHGGHGLPVVKTQMWSERLLKLANEQPESR